MKLELREPELYMVCNEGKEPRWAVLTIIGDLVKADTIDTACERYRHECAKYVRARAEINGTFTRMAEE